MYPTLRRATIRLALLCTAQFMLILDVVVINVALPAIRTGLAIGDAQLPLIGVAYTLTFGSLLVVFGRAGDLLGRRRLFVAGLVVFTAASVLAGAATHQGALFAGRAAQGVGAAMVSPTALALLLAAFPEGVARNRALGIWGAVGSAGAIAGQVIGGALVTAFGWRSIFLINVPVAVVVISGALLTIADQRRTTTPERIDRAGATLLTGSLLVVTAALVRVADHGVDATTGLLVAAAGTGLVALWRTEQRTQAPLLSPDLLRLRSVRIGNGVLALNAGTTTAALFFTTLYLQTVLGMSALAVGVAFAPVTAIVLLISPAAGKLVSRLGVRPLLVAGALSGMTGLTLLARVPTDGRYLSDVLPGLILVALMGALSYAPSFVAGTTGIDDTQQGVASGVLNTAQELGAAIGLAVLSSAAVVAAGTASTIATYRAGYLACAITCVAALLVARRAPRRLGTTPPAPYTTLDPAFASDAGGAR